jgi:AAA domain
LNAVLTFTFLLFFNLQQEKSICCRTHEQNDSEITDIPEQILSIDLNQSQLEVVKSTISSVQCNKSSSTELVWGPPGTGKTKTVGSILWSLRQFKIHTLTCAPTNVAVLGVCSRFVRLLKHFEGSSGDSDGPPICLADVVLFGNRGRMDVVGDLEDIFLDNRINCLKNCFSSTTGWRCTVNSMIHFLENCVSMYDMLVEKCKEEQKVSVSFGDYLRRQLKELEKNLNSCFQTIFVHLPRRFLSSECCTNILSLLDLLRELDEMLRSVITDEQLKKTFGAPSSHVFSVQKKLVDCREECLKQLRNLQETLTLSLSSLTNGCSIRDFCMQNATLVFCTASSSFLLHYAEKSCFNVVVIDEAAQLKECESIIPLTLSHVKHAVLVGDECQLPALVQSRVTFLFFFIAPIY